MKLLLCIGILTISSLSPKPSAAQPPHKPGKLIVFNNYIGILKNDSVLFFQPRLDEHSYRADSLKGPWAPVIERYTDDDGKEVLHSPNIKIPTGTRQILTNERLWATVNDSTVIFQNHIVGKDTGLVFPLPKSRPLYFLTGLASTEPDLLAIQNNQLVYTTWDGGPWKPFQIFDKTFSIPSDFENVFMFGQGGMLVQANHKLQLYGEVLDLLTGDHSYKYHPEFDFSIPAGTEEVIVYNAKFIGLRTGHILKFYIINQPAKTWDYKRDLDFELPF